MFTVESIAQSENIIDVERMKDSIEDDLLIPEQTQQKTGMFRLLSESNSSSIVYAFSGTAVYGVDYYASHSGRQLDPNGILNAVKGYQHITIYALSDGFLEGKESVSLRIFKSPEYRFRKPDLQYIESSLSVSDDPKAYIKGILYSENGELKFKLTRYGDANSLSFNLPVPFTLATTVPASTYRLSGPLNGNFVVFRPGVSTVIVTLTPIQKFPLSRFTYSLIPSTNAYSLASTSFSSYMSASPSPTPQATVYR